MAKTRASIFDGDAIDVSGFAPKAGPDPKAVPAEQVRAIAEASRFPSRQAAPPAAPVATGKRPTRRHRTGRTGQLNARATQATIDAFYAIADRQGWLVGETLERAVAALERELEQGRG